MTPLFALTSLLLAASPAPPKDEARLAGRLREIAAPAGGTVAFTAIHVESGRTVSLNGGTAVPLYSIFKLPLAITVLHEAEKGRLTLDRKLRVTAKDVAPGAAHNTRRWREPAEVSVRDLLDVSIVESDNTSSDKLLDLVGGPSAVTRHMAALGFPSIDVQMSVKQFAAAKGHPNTATSDALAELLVALQDGKALRAAERSVLLEMMGRTTTGLRRLRGALPEGTPVVDKTGSGPRTTNDVGIVTLPGRLGHIAMAALVDRSTQPLAEQERLIAALARAVYDAWGPIDPLDAGGNGPNI